MDGSIISKIFTVIATLIIFVVILYLAYITTKTLGKRYSLGNTGNKNFKVFDSMSLGQDRMLMIVKAGQKVILIGTGKEHIEYICDIDESQLTVSEQTSPSGPADFAQILKKAAQSKIDAYKSKGDKNENQK